MSYIVNCKQSHVTMTCKLGEFGFSKGQIIEDELGKSLSAYFPDVFIPVTKTNIPTVVPVIVAPVVEEPVVEEPVVEEPVVEEPVVEEPVASLEGAVQEEDLPSDAEIAVETPVETSSKAGRKQKKG